MQLQCPHCHNPIRVLDEHVGEIVCPGCGSSFRNCSEPFKTTEDAIRVVGRFQLMERLGIGGFGAVYRARDIELDRIVAVKIAHAHYLDSSQDKQRFVREARAAAQLRHPGIVPVHEVVDLNGMPAIVSDYVDGLTLRDLLLVRRLTFREAAELVATVAEALDYAHSLGIVHRDIKPANIMIEFPKGKALEMSLEGSSSGSHNSSERGPRALLLDFGLALRDEAEVTMTIDGQILGTPAYMSPEQAAGQSHTVDRRCDVYSLGVVLYELLAGELPFRGSKVMMVQQVLRDEPRPPRKVNERIPRDLDTICLKAMSKLPSARYASARELAEDLRRFLASEPIRARPAGTLERTWRWCARNRTVSALTAAILLSLAAGAAASARFATQANARALAEAEARANAVAHQKRAEGLVTAERDARLAEAEARAAAELAAKKESEARSAADKESQRAFRSYYAAQMQLAQGDWAAARVGPLRIRLQKTLPESTGGIDLRGFEWHYLRRLCDASMPQRFRGASPRLFYSDGWRLATAFYLSTISVHDYYTGKIIKTLKTDGGRLFVLNVSPDGRKLAATNNLNEVSVWDIETEKLLGKFATHRYATPAEWMPSINHLEFDGDGERLATCGKDSTIKLWTCDGKLLRTMRGKSGAAVCLKFTPEGELLSSGYSDHTLKLWDLEKGELKREFAHDPQGALQFAVRPDGQRVAATYGDRTLKVWEIEGDTRLLVIRDHSSDINSVAFAPDGKQIATTSNDQVVRLWDASTGELVRSFKGHEGMVSGVSYSSDGREVGCTSGPDQALVFPTNDPQQFLPLRGHAGGVIHLTFDREGTRLASGGLDQLIHIWDLKRDRLSRVLRGHTLYVDWLSFSNSGDRLASAGRDRTARVWDPQSGRELLVIPSPDKSQFVSSAQFDPDGNDLLVTVANRIEIRDAKTGEIKNTFQGSGSMVHGAIYSPNGQQIAALCGDNKLQIWDVPTKQLKATFPGTLFGKIAFSPDGRLIAAPGYNNTVLVWEIETEKIFATFRGHGGIVRSIAFHPEGKRVASGAFDYAIRIWDLESGEEMLTLPATPQSVEALAFSQDGLRLAGAGGSTIYVYDGHPFDAAAAVQRDAWMLYMFFESQQLPTSEIRKRIEGASGVREPVRQRALQLLDA